MLSETASEKSVARVSPGTSNRITVKDCWLYAQQEQQVFREFRDA
jgi:hypothetical protein